ncbi:uncharacterized protein LOC114318042 isoform X3 [Camellia sinensis]|uniref:uncharacterized protein LOC114318042 isoform X3 n=1 Tax=Camellia sinensis TaxID=4442 RepID=UPI00103663A6|nr:uncharacterized protein LOC114318042 isoform X3 [Camellia sinensis]
MTKLALRKSCKLNHVLLRGELFGIGKIVFVLLRSTIYVEELYKSMRSFFSHRRSDNGTGKCDRSILYCLSRRSI